MGGSVMLVKRNGYILYRGPSEIDGRPIVAIALFKSANRKTGNEIQTYIMRSDMSPIDAIRQGADISICGSCPHRGADGFDGRKCYVNVGQAPTVIYKVFAGEPIRKNVYGKPYGYWSSLAPKLKSQLLRGRVVRLGSYGDPAAVPFKIWAEFMSHGHESHTGYTHQWKTCNPALARYVMASVDRSADVPRALARGYRYFRVRFPGHAIGPGEINCLSATHGIPCHKCRLCHGSAPNTKNITIEAHGPPNFMVALLKKGYWVDPLDQ